MWLAILIILGIVLCIAGLVWGTLWILVPALLLIAGGLAFQFGLIRSDADRTGRLDKGANQADAGRGQPEDGTSTATDPATGYAHGGQRHMTP